MVGALRVWMREVAAAVWKTSPWHQSRKAIILMHPPVDRGLTVWSALDEGVCGADTGCHD